jgi:hypothetical protein
MENFDPLKTFSLSYTAAFCDCGHDLDFLYIVDEEGSGEYLLPVD